MSAPKINLLSEVVANVFADDDHERLTGRRRRRVPRARTIAVKNMGARELRAAGRRVPDHSHLRPQTRAECIGTARPCPWVACKHHLYLDVNPDTGAIKLNFPAIEPWQLARSCSLDEAELGGLSLEEVGELTNLTREGCRQIELRGLLKLRFAKELS